MTFWASVREARVGRGDGLGAWCAVFDTAKVSSISQETPHTDTGEHTLLASFQTPDGKEFVVEFRVKSL